MTIMKNTSLPWNVLTSVIDSTELLLLSANKLFLINSLNSRLFFFLPCPVLCLDNKICLPGIFDLKLFNSSVSWYFWRLYSMISRSKGCLTITADRVLLSGSNWGWTAQLFSLLSRQGSSNKLLRYSSACLEARRGGTQRRTFFLPLVFDLIRK